MKEFMKRYRYFLRNGFDVVEAAYIAKWQINLNRKGIKNEH